MTVEYEITREGSIVKVFVKLKEDIVYEDIDVHLEGCDFIEINLGILEELLRVILPCDVESEECKVRLNKKKALLTVTLQAQNKAIEVAALDSGFKENTEEKESSPSTKEGSASDAKCKQIIKYPDCSEPISKTPDLELELTRSLTNAPDKKNELEMDGTEPSVASPSGSFNENIPASERELSTISSLALADVQAGVSASNALELSTTSSTSTPFHVCLVPPRITSLGALRAANKGPSKKKGHKGEGTKWAELARPAAAGLLERGWAVVDNFAGLDAINKVRAEIVQLETQYENGEIWVGKEAQVGAQLAVGSVRGDKVLWVDQEALRCGPFSALRELMRSIDRFVVRDLGAKVPRLARVTERSDPMLAIYPGGGSRFQKHIDNTAKDGRVLTVLCYLNPTWDPRLGGSLRLHPDTSSSSSSSSLTPSGPVDVCPAGGRLALFWADSVPHEVLPSKATRHSVTMWFYDTKERDRAVEKGAVERHSHSPHVLSHQSDMQAKAFMKEMLTQNIDPVSLYQMSKSLNKDALTTVATITGAKSGDEFLEGLSRVDSNHLAKLRSSLIDMGIE